MVGRSSASRAQLGLGGQNPGKTPRFPLLFSLHLHRIHSDAGFRNALGGLLRDRADLAFGRRIVYSDVETAEARDGLRDKIAAIVLFANIRPDVFSL
jgi:hypothetical protein